MVHSLDWRHTPNHEQDLISLQQRCLKYLVSNDNAQPSQTKQGQPNTWAYMFTAHYSAQVDLRVTPALQQWDKSIAYVENPPV